MVYEQRLVKQLDRLDALSSPMHAVFQADVAYRAVATLGHGVAIHTYVYHEPGADWTGRPEKPRIETYRFGSRRGSWCWKEGSTGRIY